MERTIFEIQQEQAACRHVGLEIFCGLDDEALEAVAVALAIRTDGGKVFDCIREQFTGED